MYAMPSYTACMPAGQVVVTVTVTVTVTVDCKLFCSHDRSYTPLRGKLLGCHDCHSVILTPQKPF
jgi:hypothetical protein